VKRDLSPETLPQIGEGVVASLRSLSATGARFELRVGEGTATVSAAMIADFQLKPGRVITPAAAEEIGGAAQRLRVFDKAVALLAVRARSARDLRLALLRRGAPAPDADKAVADLLDLGLLDDVGYARALAHGRASGTGMSRRRVTQVLARKGVEGKVADAAAREAFEGVDETEAATRLAERRMRSLARLDPATRKRRLHAYLARRGYDGDVIRRVLALVLAAVRDAD
jgi:regulatory protein